MSTEEDAQGASWSYSQPKIDGGATVHYVHAWGAKALTSAPARRSGTRGWAKVDAAYQARLELAGGIDAYYDSGGCLGPFGGRPPRQGKVTSVKGERTLEDAMAELVKARRKVDQLEAEVRRLFAEGVKRGERLAVLGRTLGVSRQRAHQMARELDA